MYYLKEQIDGIKSKLDVFFDKNEKLEPKDIKEIAGVSRKIRHTLLEYFDGIGYTVKKGEYRIKK
jgi:Elongation factor SelB, winged helix.